MEEFGGELHLGRTQRIVLGEAETCLEHSSLQESVSVSMHATHPHACGSARDLVVAFVRSHDVSNPFEEILVASTTQKETRDGRVATRLEDEGGERELSKHIPHRPGCNSLWWGDSEL